MRFRLLLVAIILSSMSACAPQVLCPAYAVDDVQDKQERPVQEQDM